MPRLPTVKLVHKKTGKRQIVNQTDYARNLGAWDDWKIQSMKHGDATDAEVIEAAVESDINETRLDAVGADKWRGDRDRKQAEQAVVVTTETAAALKPIDMAQKWPELRKAIHERTGVWPKNKAHANELVNQ